MKKLKELLISEQQQTINYVVQFLGLEDDDNLPFSVRIQCPKENIQLFENWLKKQEGKTISHVDSDNITY